MERFADEAGDRITLPGFDEVEELLALDQFLIGKAVPYRRHPGECERNSAFGSPRCLTHKGFLLSVARSSRPI